MATLVKGSVTFADGTTHPFTAGPRERIKAERQLGIKTSDFSDGNVGEEYIVFLAYEGLKRDGTIPADRSFDDFIDADLGDYEVDVTGESQTPPEQ